MNSNNTQEASPYTRYTTRPIINRVDGTFMSQVDTTADMERAARVSRLAGLANVDMSQGHCSSLPTRREITAANNELRGITSVPTARVHAPVNITRRDDISCSSSGVIAGQEYNSSSTSVPTRRVVRSVNNVYNSNSSNSSSIDDYVPRITSRRNGMLITVDASGVRHERPDPDRVVNVNNINSSNSNGVKSSSSNGVSSSSNNINSSSNDNVNSSSNDNVNSSSTTNANSRSATSKRTRSSTRREENLEEEDEDETATTAIARLNELQVAMLMLRSEFDQLKAARASEPPSTSNSASVQTTEALPRLTVDGYTSVRLSRNIDIVYQFIARTHNGHLITIGQLAEPFTLQQSYLISLSDSNQGH